MQYFINSYVTHLLYLILFCTLLPLPTKAILDKLIILKNSMKHIEADFYNIKKPLNDGQAILKYARQYSILNNKN
jgi:hypothetical protein